MLWADRLGFPYRGDTAIGTRPRLSDEEREYERERWVRIRPREAAASDEEWAARNAVLSRQMADLIGEYSAPGATVGIEIGCQQGALTEQMERLTRVPTWIGIDPALAEETVTDTRLRLAPRAGEPRVENSGTRRSMSRCSATS